MTRAASKKSLGLAAGGVVAAVVAGALAMGLVWGGVGGGQAGRTSWLAAGPWGRVEMTRFVIRPPAGRTFALQPGREEPWVLPNIDQAQLADFLADLGLSSPQLRTLVDTSQVDPPDNGFAFSPSAKLIRHLPAQARETLYDRLSQDAVNLDQVNAFRYWGDSTSQWLSATGVSSTVERRVAKLSYHNGPWVCFADLPLVARHVSDAAARARLVRALCAQSTLRLTLHIRHGQDIAPLARYWGRAGREKQVAALLMPLAESPHGGMIDIKKLLPPFAREHLYTYPTRQAALPTGDSRDCHWSALNFYSRQAQSRFADKTVVAATLRLNYHEVKRPRFGDLVEFISNGSIFHSAVYLAGGILFTKNGARLTQPWELLPLKVMKYFYPKSGEVQIVYLRKISQKS